MSGTARIGTLLVLLFGVLALGLQPVSSAPMPSTARGIVGSWVVVPTSPGRPPGTPNVFTFTSDGTVIRFSILDSGATGAWVRTSDRTLTYTFIALYHNAGGDFTGTQKVRVNATLNATYDEFTSSGKADRFDAHGRLVRSFNFTNRGTRIKVESP